MGKLIRVISENGGIICYAIDSTDIVQKAKDIHNTSKTITAALGRLLTVGSMMGSFLKNKTDSLTLRIAGDGAVKAFIVVSDYLGNVRGYATDPSVELPLNSHGKLDVAGVVGTQGAMHVIKDLGMHTPYIGQTPLISGEIAEDITHYFATSEQIPTVCALGVLVAKGNECVISAGGYIVQLLPGATQEEITHLEQNIEKLPTISNMIAQGNTPQQIAFALLDGFSPSILDETTVAYQCNCSMERMEKMLISLGSEELEKMADEEEFTQIECHFCDKKHKFSSDNLKKIAKTIKNSNS